MNLHFLVFCAGGVFRGGFEEEDKEDEDLRIGRRKS